MSRLLPPADLDLAHQAAQKVVDVHRSLAEFLRRGQTLGQVDAFVARRLEELRCKSCFLGYKQGRSPAFPSYACLSLNECIVHGTAGYITRPLETGDVLSIDIGVTHRGWIGDAAWTYILGETDEERTRLVRCGKESLQRGIRELRPGAKYIEFARVVQTCVEMECGYHCVRGLGGHGYGRKLHAPPYVANHVPSYAGEWPDALTTVDPGTLVALEPMIAAGTPEIHQKARQWPVFTADGSLSVHFEHDVYVDEQGPRILTEGLDDLPEVVG